MNEIFYIIGVWALANLFVSALALHVKFPQIDHKPFNCALCMTWWIGLIIMIPIFEFDGIMYTAIATILNYYTYDPTRF